MVNEEIKNKVILVTGGATGIGAGVARAFLTNGAKHVAILDLAEQAGKELEESLNSTFGNGKAKFYKCDVTNEEQLFKAFDDTVKIQGYIDFVINNAGVMNDSKPVYKKMIDINVTAVVTGTLKAIEVMRKDKGGRGGAVLNISSIAGLHLSPVFPIYYGTKAAVLMFSSCIGMDPIYSRSGVRVMSICFGGTDTSLLHWTKLGVFDKDLILQEAQEATTSVPRQRLESAIQSVVDVYKKGTSGSTWLAENDEPVRDISKKVSDGYNTMYDVPDALQNL